MFDPFSASSHLDFGGLLGLSQEYLLAGDHVVPVEGASGGHHGGGGGGGGTGGGGSPSTLVGSSAGLQIDLLWESSVTTNPAAAAIESAVTAAASIYTNLFGA